MLTLQVYSQDLTEGRVAIILFRSVKFTCHEPACCVWQSVSFARGDLRHATRRFFFNLCNWFRFCVYCDKNFCP